MTEQPGIVHSEGGTVGPGGDATGTKTAELRRLPGSLPYPDLPAGTDTIPKIEHIVVLMMENHSYDNKLGMLSRPGADGFPIGPRREADGNESLRQWRHPARVSDADDLPVTGQAESDLAGQPHPVRIGAQHRLRRVR